MKLRSKKIIQPKLAKLLRTIKSSNITPERTTNKKKEISLKEALEKLYIDTKSAPSYSAKINEFLRENTVHSVHRRIVKKIFPRRKIIARFPFDIFMADLIEYPTYKFQNNRYVYILIMIDCFTKKVWAVAMKQKTAQWTSDAFESVFKKLDEFPTHIITDGGLGKYVFILFLCLI